VILKDKRKLDISYVPEKTPCREEEQQRLSLLLDSGHALISGPVGTGKTLLARHADGDVYVNCYTHKSEHKVLEAILRQTRPKFSTAGLTSQRLWQEIEGEHLFILDEIDGMMPDDLVHFAYTLSRHEEIGESIRYVAVTRSALMLKQLMNDPATWSTFAEKAVVELKPYSKEEMMEILAYRADEALMHDGYDDDILSLIADIAITSAGHMRAGIDVLRTSAMVADQRGHDMIAAEDVREANREGWLEGLEELERRPAMVLLAVARACTDGAYVSAEAVEAAYASVCEEYDVEPGPAADDLGLLFNRGWIHESDRGYTVLTSPAELMATEIEKFLNQ